MQWKHIDFNNHTLTVCQQVLNPSTSNRNNDWYISISKTNSSNRTIPVPAVLLKDLLKLKKSNEAFKKFKLS